MYEFKTKPFKHQRDALGDLSSSRNWALFMEMGTGKSKCLIDDIGRLYCSGEIDLAIVFAPLGIVDVWLREIETHLGVDARVQRWWSGGGNKGQQKHLSSFLTPGGLRIFVVNIEAFQVPTKIELYMNALLKSSSVGVWGGIDESPLIKTHNSKRTKHIQKIASSLDYRRIATGTPMTNSPLDLFSQFRFLDPDILGHSYFSFRARYAHIARKEFGGRKVDVVVGYKNVGRLAALVSKHSTQVTKEECLDLPSKVYQSRVVELSDEQRRVYGELRRQSFAEIGEDGFVQPSAAITVLLRLHQVTAGHVTDEDGVVHSLKNGRITALMQYLAETRGDVIIWARFRHSYQEIVQAIAKEYGNVSVAQFHGGNTETRGAESERFINDPSCRFMVASQQAAGRGITWVNATNVCYFSNSLSLEERLQSEDRAHRSGQTKTVVYTDLIAPGTVDETILRSHRKKINISDELMTRDYRKWLI